jgi:S1-C subfamily serine protease
MESSSLESKQTKIRGFLLTVIILTSLFSGVIGYFVGYFVFSSEVDGLKIQISELEQQFDDIESFDGTGISEVVLLSDLFDEVRLSVVVVEATIRQLDLFGRGYYIEVQGSGFVIIFDKELLIVTSYHIISDAQSISVTFINGTTYEASILNSNPLVDLAFLTTSAPESEYIPLEIDSSGSLRVGNPVIVVGTPYGLEGSMSEGIVSALNRTLIVDNDIIENVVQTTAPINPGNSGGPLLNYEGKVVGVVTARIADSEGIGFAITSDVILKNLGTYFS